jgi:hypothetical protein
MRNGRRSSLPVKGDLAALIVVSHGDGNIQWKSTKWLVCVRVRLRNIEIIARR